MKVKLMRRDEKSRDVIRPIVSLGMGGNGHIPTQKYIWDAESAYRASHDAAPDEATRALMELVRAADELDPNDPSSVDCWLLAEALGNLRTTPEGAALIRQAMDRDDG